MTIQISQYELSFTTQKVNQTAYQFLIDMAIAKATASYFSGEATNETKFILNGGDVTITANSGSSLTISISDGNFIGGVSNGGNPTPHLNNGIAIIFNCPATSLTVSNPSTQRLVAKFLQETPNTNPSNANVIYTYEGEYAIINNSDALGVLDVEICRFNQVTNNPNYNVAVLSPSEPSQSSGVKVNQVLNNSYNRDTYFFNQSSITRGGHYIFTSNPNVVLPSVEVLSAYGFPEYKFSNIGDNASFVGLELVSDGLGKFIACGTRNSIYSYLFNQTTGNLGDNTLINNFLYLRSGMSVTLKPTYEGWVILDVQGDISPAIFAISQDNSRVNGIFPETGYGSPGLVFNGYSNNGTNSAESASFGLGATFISPTGDPFNGGIRMRQYTNQVHIGDFAYESEIDTLQGSINSLQIQINTLSNNITTINSEISKIKNTIESQNIYLGASVVLNCIINILDVPSSNGLYCSSGTQLPAPANITGVAEWDLIGVSTDLSGGIERLSPYFSVIGNEVVGITVQPGEVTVQGIFLAKKEVV